MTKADHYYPHINVVVLKHVPYGIDQVIPINYKEAQLLLRNFGKEDKSEMDNKLLFDSLHERTGIRGDDGNWKIDQFWINGEGHLL